VAVGTDYVPTLTPGLKASRDHGTTAAALAAKAGAAAAGAHIGRMLIPEVAEAIDNAEGADPNLDPYLEYLIYLSAGQALINEGRRIAGLDTVTEPEGRKKR
jgi:hypothetical protein